MITLKYRNSMPPAVTRELDLMVARLNVLLSAVVNPDGTAVTTPAATVSEVGLPVGTIVPYGGTAAPNTSWLMCDGGAHSRATYAALFAVTGTAFGAGDGSTTFNVPDMRGRFPLGKATAGTGSTLGGSGGSIDHTHTGPSHTHAVTGITVSAPTTTTVVQSGAGTTVASSTHLHTLGGTADADGAGSTGTANPPFVAVNYILLAQ